MTTTTAVPDRYRTSESTVQCRCPFCGGCFNPDSDRSPKRDELFRCGCARCGHVWASSIENPSRCPRCGNSKWREPVKPCLCRMCGYKWNPRSSGKKPVFCPSCRSKEWDSDDSADKGRIDEAAILARYESGDGCIAIASEMDVALFEVIGIVMEATGEDEPWLRSAASA